MLRWLFITIIALGLFLTVILILGWLLQNNEAETKAFVQALDEQNQRQKEEILKQVFVADEPEIDHKLAQEIVLNNLTCVDDAQCQLLLVPELSDNCFISINNIGASMLRPFINQQTKRAKVQANEQCQQLFQQTKAICMSNHCSF